MKNVKLLFEKLIAEDSGQDLIEYALVCGPGLTWLDCCAQRPHECIGKSFNSVGNGLTNAV